MKRTENLANYYSARIDYAEVRITPKCTLQKIEVVLKLRSLQCVLKYYGPIHLLKYGKQS